MTEKNMAAETAAAAGVMCTLTLYLSNSSTFGSELNYKFL